MTQAETPQDFESDPALEQIEQKTRARIGDEKVDERMEQLAQMSLEDTMALKEKADAVMTKVANCLTFEIESEEMQAIIREYLLYTNFAYSKLQGKSVLIDQQRFIKMADSITQDADQKAVFEQFGEGTAEHFAKAMTSYAEKNL
ncbi:TipAS antibiotic-recognition domain-containing protein [Thalassotalea aquiviva]|uniref:TipAS antibiotic-recognition domain-containing protein n=1 Tax=Thalassotalea aquiviva TaxID=3242415 RepID=UPI00352BCAF2